MTASEFRWPTLEAIRIEAAKCPNDCKDRVHAPVRVLLGEIETRAATLTRVRALADRWAADNQTVWATELRKVLEG
jgi:hypothetical protein